MTEDQARQRVVENVAVTTQMVNSAKQLILDSFNRITGVRKGIRTDTLIRDVLEAVQAQQPNKIVLDVEPQPQLDLLAQSISWRTAACEAIWELIHNSLLTVMSDQFIEVDPIGWTVFEPLLFMRRWAVG